MPDETREVMDIIQAAKYLGLSADTLYRYASTNAVPAFKFCNRWRFKKGLLDEWMERQSTSGMVGWSGSSPSVVAPKPSRAAAGKR